LENPVASANLTVEGVCMRTLRKREPSSVDHDV